MKIPHLVPLAALFGLGLGVAFAQPPTGATAFTPPEPAPKFYAWAQTPPMGWNSWDCYGAGVWQDDTLAKCRLS